MLPPSPFHRHPRRRTADGRLVAAVSTPNDCVPGGRALRRLNGPRMLSSCTRDQCQPGSNFMTRPAAVQEASPYGPTVLLNPKPLCSYEAG